MVPDLALQVVNRIAISISKDSRAVQRPMICRGKCYMELEGHLYSPTSITCTGTGAKGKPGWDEMPGKNHFLPRSVAKQSIAGGSFRPPEDHQCLKPLLQLCWHLEEMKNSRTKQRKKRELDSTRWAMKEGREKCEGKGGKATGV
jgi:hypothetical protein